MRVCLLFLEGSIYLQKALGNVAGHMGSNHVKPFPEEKPGKVEKAEVKAGNCAVARKCDSPQSPERPCLWSIELGTAGVSCFPFLRVDTFWWFG